jgi:hypothetical protein
MITLFSESVVVGWRRGERAGRAARFFCGRAGAAAADALRRAAPFSPSIDGASFSALFPEYSSMHARFIVTDHL